VSAIGSELAVAPAPRYRFVALGVVWSAYLVVFLSRLCVGPLSPFLKASFHLSNAQIGGLTSATAIAYMPTMPFAGWLADRIGVRRVLVIGTLITGVSVGGVALAPSYSLMLLLLACSGFGCGFIYPTAIKAIMTWFPARECATAVGINQSAVNVSGMLGAALMPTMALSLGWQSGFILASAMAFAICVLAAAFYREPRPEERPASLAATRPIVGGAHAGSRQESPPSERDVRLSGKGASLGFLAVLRSRDILLLGFAAMFLCMVEFSAVAQLVLFLKADWAYTVVAAGGLLALCQGAGAIGKPLSGFVSDRWLARRRRPALIALAVLAAVACVMLALIRPGQTLALWLALALLGLGAIGWGGLLGTLAGETAGPASAGAAAGVTGAIDNIGIFVGPPLFGWIVDRTGSYAPAWWTMCAAAVFAAILLALVRERHFSDGESPGHERVCTEEQVSIGSIA
jgi:ACS family hexuronate transporter-like MFS transporter